MRLLNGILVLYAITLVILGVMGFEKHPPSFYMSTAAAVVVAIGTWWGNRNRYGYILPLLVALANLGRFGPKLLGEFKIVPDLAVSIASAIALVALVAGHLAMRKSAAGAG